MSFQVASLFGFSMCSLEFLLRAHRRSSERNPLHADLYNSKKFKLFLAGELLLSHFHLQQILTNTGLMFSATTLFTRTVFRSVELSEGFGGHLANSEVQFMILDGVMVILACLSLSILHPGIGFGNKWGDAKFPFRIRKEAVVDLDRELGGETANETETSAHAPEKYT